MFRLPCFGLGLICAIGTLIGCTSNQPPAGTPVERMWESPAPAQPAPGTADAATVSPSPLSTTASRPAAAASQPGADPLDIIAVVNGIPIGRAVMADELIRSHGLPLLEQMILLIAARQRAHDMGLSVTQKDIAAAYEDALKRLSTPVGAPDELPLDRAAAEKLLDEFLVAKNISRSEWERRMEQQAYMHKIAASEAAKIPISPSMLREQYALEYGQRVQIRHIQVSSLAAVQRVREALSGAAVNASTATQPAASASRPAPTRNDFELVARKLSENQITASRGGLMAPFTRSDPSVPPLLREAAFSLQPGQISPAINEGTWYHLLRLERLFPASEVGFENVDAESLKAHLLERLTAQRQDALEAELFRAASVDVRDIELGRQFRSRHRAGR